MIDNEVTIKAIQETVKQIAFLLGGANVLLIGLMTWLGKIWMDRILESERRKTQIIVEQLKSSLTQEREQLNQILKTQLDQILESERRKTQIIVEQLKDSLTQEREKLNQVLKTQLDQSRYFFEQSILSFSNNQKVLTDKELNTFEKLWKSIYHVRKIAPFYLDILYEDEYTLIRKRIESPKLRARIDEIDEHIFIDQVQADCYDVDVLRIYIPPIILQLYVSYRMIVLRPQILIKRDVNSKSDQTILAWYFDKTLREIIENILDENEIKEFNEKEVGQ